MAGARRLIWSARARVDVLAIRDYIDAFSPLNAERFARRLVNAVETLVDLPERGRSVGANLRDFTAIWPYVVRYRVTASAVHILRIKHGARRPG